MRIFISWSKRKSMQFALRIKELLEHIDPTIEAFVSEEDIQAGEDVQAKILDKIIECDKLILCFTKDNKKSPWLLFEAGYARGLHKTVIPFLFDIDSAWHSWVDNPMNIAREISYNHSQFVHQFIKGLELDNTPAVRQKLRAFQRDIDQIKEDYRLMDECCEDFVDKLVSNDAFTIENPVFRNRTAYFFAGFESFDLFKIITQSFLYTGKHLWIYGRRNMKLFGGGFKEFFRYLDEKSYNDPYMGGIDFRCLFLNPDSDEVAHAHQSQDYFKQELVATLLRAKEVIGDNKNFEKCFRLYSNKREAIIIRLDNCIIYSRPSFDANGVPQLLTNSHFEVFSVDSPRGQECINAYEKVWESACPINYPLSCFQHKG